MSATVSAVPESMDWKKTIIDSLDVLRKRDVAEKQTFKARAYAKVISQLKEHDGPIRSYEDVKNIQGIGEKISSKIKEILETGHLASAERAMELYPIEALDAFQDIYGVGPAKAKELVNDGYRTIVELREAVQQNPKLLNDKQKIGLQYYEDLLERIPRSEMEEHQEILQFLLPENMKEYEMDIVGSFRRQAATSGDIDVLLRVPKDTDKKEAKQHLEEYVHALKQHEYIEEVLALGEHKCMAISRIPGGKARRLDLLMTPDEEYAYAILYFTGSDKFNVAFRQHALQKGYTLNEHTLKPIREGVRDVPYMKTEREIFSFLGLRYVEPNHRIDGNQIIPQKISIKIVRPSGQTQSP
jgi:DNA polymerase beta